MMTKHIVQSDSSHIQECSRMGKISAIYKLHQLELICGQKAPSRLIGSSRMIIHVSKYMHI